MRDFVDKIQTLVNEAKRGLINPNVYVNIFTGLCGMTGSGSFLDVCYLVQKALEYDDYMTYGYFFLPDVNL